MIGAGDQLICTTRGRRKSEAVRGTNSGAWVRHGMAARGVGRGTAAAYGWAEGSAPDLGSREEIEDRNNVVAPTRFRQFLSALEHEQTRFLS